MVISDSVYSELRRYRYTSQDADDRIQDAAVFLLEHVGEYEKNGETITVETDEHKIALGFLHIKGKIRNAGKRAIHESLTDAAAFAIAERATAIRPDTTRQDLAERIAALPMMQQDICRMLLEGLTQAEIAKKLALKASTLRERIRTMRNVNR